MQRKIYLDAYLQKLVLTKEGKPGGKKFHDPLAACCAIDEEIATWAEVELYREGQKWGGEWGPNYR